MASEAEIPEETLHHFKASMHRFAEDTADCWKQEHLSSLEPLINYQDEDLGTKTKHCPWKSKLDLDWVEGWTKQHPLVPFHLLY